jgi:hypothetical protein
VTDNASVVPPVVALVIVERADDALDNTLAALSRQDVGSLRVLVMDATAEGAVLLRTDELAPAAIVRRANARTFAGAANEASRLIAGSGFLCLLAAGVEPEPTAFRDMLEEAFRSNAGVVGPKFVDRTAPERLDSVGFGSDKFAEVWMPAAAGELDQEQHDAVVDRFLLSSRCLMIRSDLFSAIGGFDDTLSSKVAEIDLCWRAHASGARVLVVPDARARTTPEEREPADARRDAAERLGLMLSNYSLAHLARVLPQAVLVTIASAIGNLVTLRPGRAAARLLAWPGVLGRLGHIRARRASFAELRNVPDADIRRLQQRGSARLGIFLRGRRGERRLAAAVGDTSRTWLDDVRSSIHWPSALAWLVVLGSFLLGSRNLLNGRVPSMAGLPNFPARASDAIGSYLSGWRPNGLGHVGAAPTGLGLIGVFGAVLAGKIGLVRSLVTVGLMVLGYVGIWRAARPFVNERSRLAALVVYGLVPLAPNALATGHWGGLAAYAAAPFAVAWLAELAGIAPWTNSRARSTEIDRVLAGVLDDDPPVGDSIDPIASAALTSQRTIAITARLVLVSALVAAIAPAWLVAVALIGVVLATCAVASRRFRDGRRAILAAAATIAGAALLHLPWALGSHGFWEGFGHVPVSAPVARLADLLRFQTGSTATGLVGWLVAPAAFVGLTFALRERLSLLVRLGALALAGFAAAWGVQRGRLPGAEVEVVLAVALVAVALAAAASVQAFDNDVRGHQLSWRQPLGFLAAFAMMAGFLPGLRAAGDGSWNTRSDVTSETVRQVTGQRAGVATAAALADANQFRVLWLGDSQALPMSGFAVAPGVDAALTAGTDAQFDDRWGAVIGRGEATIASGLTLASEGSTSRLGLVLAPASVRFVVVPLVRSDGRAAAIPAGFERMLDSQLDLRRIITGDERLAIFQNESWLPMRTQLSPSARDASTRQGVAELVGADLGASTAVLAAKGTATWTGEVAPGDVFVSIRNEPGFSLTVDGKDVAKRPAFGWAQAFTVPTAGQATLTYRTPLARRALVGLQALLWLIAVAVALRGGRLLPSRRAALVPVVPLAVGAALDGDTAIRFDDLAASEPAASAHGGIEVAALEVAALESAATDIAHDGPESFADGDDQDVQDDDVQDDDVQDDDVQDDDVQDDVAVIAVVDPPAEESPSVDADDDDAARHKVAPEFESIEPTWMVASDRFDDDVTGDQR